MKRAAFSFLTFLVAVSISSYAWSGEGRIYQTAKAGHAQSTLAVSAIDGTMRFTVGQVERRAHISPFYINPPGFHPKYNRHSRNYRSYKHDRYCRNMERYVYKYGKRYIIAKQVCRDDGKYRRGYLDRRGYRDYGRYDKYRDRDRYDGYRERGVERKRHRDLDRIRDKDRYFRK